MNTTITHDFLREHFRKHNSITLYKADGTPVTFTKQHHLVLCGGHSRFTFRDYESLAVFYQKQRLCLKPVITIE